MKDTLKYLRSGNILQKPKKTHCMFSEYGLKYDFYSAGLLIWEITQTCYHVIFYSKK